MAFVPSGSVVLGLLLALEVVLKFVLSSISVTGLASLVAQLVAESAGAFLPIFISYGSTALSIVPGRSSLVLSISSQPSGMALRKKAVPRIS